MLPSAALRCFEFEACTAARACVDDAAAAGCRLLTALVTASEPPCAATFFFFFLRACEGTATERFCSSIDRLKRLVALIHRSGSTAFASSAPPGSAPSPGKHEARAACRPDQPRSTVSFGKEVCREFRPLRTDCVCTVRRTCSTNCSHTQSVPHLGQPIVVMIIVTCGSRVVGCLLLLVLIVLVLQDGACDPPSPLMTAPR